MVSRLAMAAVVAIVLLTLLLTIIDRITPYRYDEINLDERLQPPSIKHIFGTDSLGRDVLTRLLYGFRLSLALSILSIAISATVGSFTGILSALSKQLQMVTDPLFNSLYIVPSIFIAAVIAFTAGFGVHIVVIAIVLRLLPVFYRIMRTVTLSVVVQPYMESVRAMGASTLHILLHYVAREAMHTVAILSIYSFPEALSIEISLNFIGLGIQPPIPSLGSIIAEGVRYVAVAPHIIVPPTVAVFITILVADIVGEKIERHRREIGYLQL